MDDELGNFRDDGRSEKISGKSDLQARGPCRAWKGVAARAGEARGLGNGAEILAGVFVTLLPLSLPGLFPVFNSRGALPPLLF